MKIKKITAVALIITILLSVIMCAAFSVNAEEIPAIVASGFSVATPEISSIVNRKAGADICWNKVAGVEKYRVFVKDGDTWTRLADTAETNYIHTTAASNHVYTYTVRAMDENNRYISDYNREGTSNRYYAAPAPVSAINIYGGVKFTWEKVAGAPGYCVYRKTDNGSWEIVEKFTTSLNYKDKNVKSGASYSYTVRVINAEKTKFLGSFYSKGITVTYHAAPEITGTKNGKKSVRIYFGKAPGAAKHSVYVRLNNEWVKVASTKEDNVLYSDVKSGVYYTYTVRAFDSKGNFLTGYNPEGYTFPYYKAPVISSVAAAAKGYTVSWKAVNDAPMYRLYRKTFEGDWSIVGYSSELSFTDKKADMSQLTTYTLRCVSKARKAISSFDDSGVYYCGGKLANGEYTVGSEKYTFKDGRLCNGFVTIDGKTYYYDNSGNVKKDTVVGNRTDGFYYAGKDGEITYKFNGIAKNDKGYWYCKNSKVDFTFRDAVTYDGEDWIVLEGKAKKVETEKDRTFFRAFKEIAKCVDSSMTKSEKLWAAFKYVQGAYTEKNPRVPHYHGEGWVELYANDMFVNKTGNCCSYGAAFAYMAKAIGYEEVYVCNSGGHGWAEIDGKVYDPEWGRHRSDKTYFGLDYDTCKSPAYKSAIAPGYWWMHVKV